MIALGLVVFFVMILVIIVAVTAIAQPPERWARWFTGKDKDNTPE